MFHSNYEFFISKSIDWDKHYGLLATANYEDLKIQGMLVSQEKGVPTGAWETLFNEEDHKTLNEHGFIELKYDYGIASNKNIMLRGYLDHYFYEASYPYEDGIELEATDNNWFGTEVQFRWDPRSDNRLIIGAEYQDHLRADYRYWTEDETFIDIDSPYNIISLYIQDEYQITKDLLINLGIRRDRYSSVGSSTNPKTAIVYSPLKSGILKLLYGEAFRIPNIYETNYEEEDYWELNPDLNPEKIRTAEIVWEQCLRDGLFGTVSIYNYRMRDLIDTIDISEALDESLFQYQNVNEVRANGLELELNTRLETGLRGYASYTFQRAEDGETGEKLTNSPSHIVKFGLVYPVFGYVYAALESQYETERLTVYDTETDPYLLTNINFSTTPLFGHLKLSLLIRNLFDVEYRLPGGFEHLQPAITQDGRNFGFKLEYKF